MPRGCTAHEGARNTLLDSPTNLAVDIGFTLWPISLICIVATQKYQHLMGFLHMWIRRESAVVNKEKNEHAHILRGIVHVALFVLVARVAGAAKEIVVAWRYGISAEIDAYLFLFNIVNWSISLWIALLTAGLVPVLNQTRNCNQLDAQRFLGELLGRSLLLGALMAVVLVAGIVLMLQSDSTGLSPTGLKAAGRMVLPLASLAPVGLLIALFSVVMLTRGRHVNTLLECVPAVVIGAAVAVLGAQTGIDALTWGTLTGFMCHAAVLGVLLRRDFDRPRLSGQSEQWTLLWAGMGTLLIAQVLMSLTSLVDQFFVTSLGEGALSTLSFAQRVLALIIGLGGTAVGRAIIPVMGRATQDDAGVQIRRLAMRWAGIVFLWGAVTGYLAWLLGPALVRVLFERGAFTAQDTEGVVVVFRAGVYQFPFNFASVVLYCALITLRRFRALAWIAGIALSVKVMANAALVTTAGAQGIVFATALMYSALAALYLVALRQATARTG